MVLNGWFLLKVGLLGFRDCHRLTADLKMREVWRESCEGIKMLMFVHIEVRGSRCARPGSRDAMELSTKVGPFSRLFLGWKKRAIWNSARLKRTRRLFSFNDFLLPESQHVGSYQPPGLEGMTAFLTPMSWGSVCTSYAYIVKPFGLTSHFHIPSSSSLLSYSPRRKISSRIDQDMKSNCWDMHGVYLCEQQDVMM